MIAFQEKMEIITVHFSRGKYTFYSCMFSLKAKNNLPYVQPWTLDGNRERQKCVIGWKEIIMTKGIHCCNVVVFYTGTRLYSFRKHLSMMYVCALNIIFDVFMLQ